MTSSTLLARANWPRAPSTQNAEIVIGIANSSGASTLIGLLTEKQRTDVQGCCLEGRPQRRVADGSTSYRRWTRPITSRPIAMRSGSGTVVSRKSERSAVAAHARFIIQPGLTIWIRNYNTGVVVVLCRSAATISRSKLSRSSGLIQCLVRWWSTKRAAMTCGGASR